MLLSEHRQRFLVLVTLPVTYPSNMFLLLLDCGESLFVWRRRFGYFVLCSSTGRRRSIRSRLLKHVLLFPSPPVFLFQLHTVFNFFLLLSMSLYFFFL